MISPKHQEHPVTSTIGQFDYTVNSMKREDSLPASPSVVIVLQRYGKGVDGMPEISATLMSDKEIDRHIGDLKADLDAVAIRAKKALAHAKDATKKLVDERRPE